MLILGIETSCDETACAIVKDGREVLCNIVASQIKTHRQYGGVVPEVAAREHLEAINVVIDEAFAQSGLKPSDTDAFSATVGPGLVGCLLVGLNAAKTLSLVYNKPFIGTDHLKAHVCANFIDTDLKPPFLCLLVSGGHTQIIKVEEYSRQEIIAGTIDDAVGEVYDKSARLLGLPYPGGITLDKLAQEGNPFAYKLPEAKVGKDEFSFSGLKTAMLRLIQSFSGQALEGALVRDICASFQERVSSTLLNKTLLHAKELGYDTLVLAGGVAANSELRKKFFALQERGEYRVFAPQMKYCTDNASMVASCAYFNPIEALEPLNLEAFSRATA
ncbi:N6-L-threonylcarbamoyladenine synthase [Candidatus Gastranaerophilus sp. (ex Termes propinquus)]|nr:N6-L-threonylcarbamoyladenine synthase [Candidatus Gastranaerophilus sp. (ex Termes propinquus)]